MVPKGLDTPALLCDEEKVRANARRYVTALNERGIALRPHAKTHKSIAVARLLIEEGAQGITTATLSEAEVFAAAGINDIFVAYPVWAAGPKAARLRNVAERARLKVGVDSIEGVDALSAAAAGSALQVLVEVDCGDGRTGARDPDAVRAIAQRCVDTGLELIGAFTHGGQGYSSAHAAAPAADDEVRALEWAKDAIESVSLECRVLSAGSTPTGLLSARDGVTEERPGTFVFGDRQQVMLGSIEPKQVALVVAATVVSGDGHGRFVIDAGSKNLAQDRNPLLDGFGHLVDYPHACLTRLNDHHGMLECASGPSPKVGEVVTIVPNHVCPVVNLAEQMLLVQGGSWAVDARSRNQ